MLSTFKKLIFLLAIFYVNTLHAADSILQININIASAPAVSESSGPLKYAVTIDSSPSLFMGDLTVHYVTVNGSAKDKLDYTYTEGDLVFKRGETTTQYISVPVVNDHEYELDENVKVLITENSFFYETIQDSAYGTIYDDDVQPLSIYLHNQTIRETDKSGSVVHFTAELNQKAPAGGVTVDYETSDGSAKAVQDYIAKSNSIFIPEGSKSGSIDIDVVGDTIPEDPDSEEFNLKIIKVSVGSIDKGDAICTITDNDAIEVDIEGFNVDEGNLGDHNQMKFRIFLKKDYPNNTALIVNFTTEDGSTPSATVGVDYSDRNGTVTFNKGELEKFVYVDIIGDNEIEENENLRMVISGSSYIVNHNAEAKIINDDGSFASISFTNNTFSISEGDSGQKFLDFNFTLSKPALDGASFLYDTWDGSAEDEAKDNDYIWTHGEYNLTVGEQKVSISVPINGDLNIENNESFHFGIFDFKKLNLSGSDEAVGVIINDDGAYPALRFIADTVSIIEGNSSVKDLNFTVMFDSPALAGSSFDFFIDDIDTNGSDYVALTKSTYSFAGGETNATISVQIKGDNEFEIDEKFYLKINNEINFTVSGDRFSMGTIINDDIEEKPFTCTENSYLFTSDQKASYTDYYSINLSSGVANNEKRFGTSHINATGYNVKDNHIYGFEYGNDDSSDPDNSYHVVRINADFKIERLNIAGLSKTRFYLGDVSMDGIFYLANRHEPISKENRLQEIQRVDLKTKTLMSKITLQYDKNTTHILTSDFAFNPKDNQIYMVNAENNQLIRVNKDSGQVEELGYVGNIGNTYSVINFFDVDGNFYFYTAGTEKIYEINISDPSNIDATATEFNDMKGVVNSGDGARCANAPVTPPLDDNAPLVCDSTMYISSTVNRENGKTGRTWLHTIDTTTNPFDFNVVDSAGAAEEYNALAYAESGDENISNYIFALEHRKLLKLTQTGKVIDLGVVSGLPSDLDNYQLFAGAIYNSIYYVAGWGYATKEIYKINLSDKTVSTLNLTTAISINDFSFSSNGKKLYGILNGGEFVSIDISDGNVNKIGSAHTNYEFDSTFSDVNNRLFANDGNGNGFFEFNVNTGEKHFISNSQPATFNDGANCLKAELLFTDYGDAPISYGPSWHNIANGIYLGDKVDHDIDSYNTVNADGDDLSGVDDDDGVTFLDGTDINGSYFELEKEHTIKVKLAKEAYLRVWIDKDINGHFSATDLIYNPASKLSAGEHTISFTLPAGLTENQITYLRARVSSTPSTNPVGLMTDGEVEDYAIKFGSGFIPLRGRFNIERTNSGSFDILTQADERNAWYTQVVGRDFDYSIVFYEEDFSAEKNVSNVTLKVELMDMDVTPPVALYQYDFHIPDTVQTSRIDITQPVNDLASLPATKNARFRVTYGVDSSGNIIQADCLSNPGLCSYNRLPDDAKDNFAIRPKDFYISIADGNEVRKENINSLPNPLRVAAGYDYNLSVVATKYPNSDYNASVGYDAKLIGQLEFVSTGNCADESNGTVTMNFVDGKFNDLNFTHDNVGKYVLKIKDTSWTDVDANKHQCNLNQSSISLNPNEPSGCDIDTISDINISFYPYQFEVALTMNNLPSNSHDFIYMSDMNSSDNNVSIQFVGSITAKNIDSNRTYTNYTDGCVAEDVILMPDATVLVDDGVINSSFPSRIRTATHSTEARENVSLTRMALFNSETLNHLHFSEISNISAPLNITREKFLDTNRGTMMLDLRYNIKKHPSLPINPIQITFHNINVSSPMAWSLANKLTMTNPYIPIGTKDLGEVRNFYFAQVAPDKIHYLRVNFNKTKIIRTPLNVDIFCKAPEAYCTQTNIFNNTEVESSPRKQEGWYLSTNHDGANDGVVTALEPSPNIVTTTVTPIPFTHGRNGLVLTKFNNCNSSKSIVVIKTTPALSYKPNGNNPYYVVECTNKDDSEWAGIGNAGNILDSKSNVNFEGKMDW